MMRAMYSGITGLRNFQNQMDVVSNNIANVNTTGFKASRITFQTTLLQTLNAGKRPDENLGGTNPMQIGLGAKVASIDKIMTQGSFQNTGKKTDIALQGDGFFIMSDGQGQFFTRAGNFTLDSTGHMVDPSSGMTLQGWSAEMLDSGRRFVNTNNPIGDIRISAGLIMPAQQTSFINLANNLNADVGIQDTTIVLRDSEGRNVPVKFSFKRDMSEDNRDLNVYNWSAEIIGDNNFLYNSGDEFSSTFTGSVRLDEAGNVTRWETHNVDGERKGDSKVYVVDPTRIRDIANNPITINGYMGDDVDPSTPLTANLTGGLYLRDAAGNLVSYDPNDITINRDGDNIEITLNIEIEDENGNMINQEITVIFDNDDTDTTEFTVDHFNELMEKGIDFSYGFDGGVFDSDLEEYTITLSGLKIEGVDGNTSLVDDIDTPNDLGDGENELIINNLDLYASKLEIQPPSGGPLRFVDIQNPQNFVSAEYRSPVVSASTLVYDSLGKAYNTYIHFEKIDTNTWRWTAELQDGTPLKILTQDEERLNQNAEGIIAFDGNGTIAAFDWSLEPNGDINEEDSLGGKGFWFDPSEVGTALNPETTPSSAAGAGPVMVELRFQDVSQFSGQHSITVNEQNGNAQGTLESFAVNDVGDIYGTFTNGRTDILGKIALANFNNPAGLLEIGDSMYVMSANSGLAQIGEAGVGGRGTMIPGALEMSNVDLAEEFTNMIISQRGFQATSRIITTADQILNELVQMKR